MGNLLTKVQIGGITVKDDSGSDPKLLINWEYERTIERGISELSMLVLRDTNDAVSLSIGKSVSVWSGFTTSTDQKEFEGEIVDFSPEGGIIKIVCQDKMHDLVKKNVNKVYSTADPQAGEISAIAKDLIETFGGLTADVEATGTEIGKLLSEFRCTQTDIYERLMKLTDAVQYQLWYDPINDTVHFEPRGFNDSGITLTVGNDIIGVPKWENDASKLVNDLRIDGAMSETQTVFPTSGTGQIGTTSGFETTGITLTKTPENVQLLIDASDPPTTIVEGGGEDSSTTNFFYVDRESKIVKPAEGTLFTSGHYALINYTWLAPAPIHLVNQESIDKFTEHELQVTLTDIITIADAEARATEILSRFSQPFKKATILVKSNSSLTMKVGDTVRVVDNINKPNIDENLIITKQVKKYPGNNQEITVGDEALRLADWQFNVEERLKRLEELLSLKNQDLLQELRDFMNQITHQPIYLKALTQEYDGASGISILGFGSSDGYFDLGSGKFGTHDDAFLDQSEAFVKQYQDSYTEEFIDDDFFDSDNSTGDWLTGIITSGQTLRSSSIDLSNGVITVATPIFTGSGAGTPTFYLMADGTNWEVVTSGVAHSFSNSGTDLRWRVDSTGGTYTITGVDIEDYH